MNNRITKVCVGLVIAIVIFFGVQRLILGERSFLDTTFSYLIYPCLVAHQKLYALGKNVITTVQEYRHLHTLVDQLRHEKELLQERYIQAQSLYAYDTLTQELVAARATYNYPENSILAQVIFSQYNPAEHTLLVDKGSLDGITPSTIAVYHHALIGRVIEVYPRYAKIAALTDVRCSVPALDTATGARGIVQGSGTANLHFNYVDHLEHVHEGDLVISSGQGILFPQGFGIGTICSCKSDSLYHTIHLKPLIECADISYCYLIQKI